MAHQVISGVRFTTAAQDQVIVGLDDGAQFKTSWPLRPPTQAFVQPWLDAGNVPAPFIEDLARVEGAELAAIDADADRARVAFATPGLYQAAEYEEAVRQAEDLLAGGAGPFPALAADVEAGTFDSRLGRAVATEAEAADLVLFTRGRWLSVLTEIRRIRLTAKAAVRTAATVEDVRAVRPSLVWPVP